jgi:dTDP-4-dehydrorhamnose 3,5-epimerase
MTVNNTDIPGLYLIEPKVFEDNRGYFFEVHNQNKFKEAGIEADFVQDNQSKSQQGVLRGMHYQLQPFAQAKLVQVFKGEVKDVVVDMRHGSPTYGQWQSFILSEDNKRQVFIPKGLAHGFLVLSDEAEFFYKCDHFYSKEHEGGFKYNDPAIGINWELDSVDEIHLSEKDQQLPAFADAANNFIYQ